MALLKQVPCGQQGFKTSQLGLGCMSMSMAYGADWENPQTRKDSIATLRRSLELGCTFFDTSNVYGPHTNELLIGEALQGVPRRSYQIATKFGITKAKASPISEDKGAEGSADYVRACCEESLKRLKTDYIDLYYQHRVDRTMPIEDTWRALKGLVEEGKVKYLGISEASAKEIERAHKIHPITACQIEYSLWTREYEENLIPCCKRLGIAIIAFSPLGRGLLTGTISSTEGLDPKDMRVASQPRWQGEAFNKNLALVEECKALAAEKQCTPGQLALAWVLHQGPEFFPIPGTKRVKYLEENVAAAQVKLTRQDLDRLEAIFHKDKVVGERYNAQGLASIARHGEQ